MYKYHLSVTENKNFDDISGIDKLLTKLEYNALTEKGRKASDYGVPEKVLKYYEEDNPQEAHKLKQSFDEFESVAFERVNKIL